MARVRFRPGTIRGLSLLLVLASLRGFSLGSPGSLFKYLFSGVNFIS